MKLSVRISCGIESLFGTRDENIRLTVVLSQHAVINHTRKVDAVASRGRAVQMPAILPMTVRVSADQVDLRVGHCSEKAGQRGEKKIDAFAVFESSDVEHRAA